MCPRGTFETYILVQYSLPSGDAINVFIQSSQAVTSSPSIIFNVGPDSRIENLASRITREQDTNKADVIWTFAQFEKQNNGGTWPHNRDPSSSLKEHARPITFHLISLDYILKEAFIFMTCNYLVFLRSC